MKLSSVILTIAVIGATATSASAQGRGKSKGNQGVPPGQRPPAGMCRIWINGVPPGHQPAPTDCETAVRNQPPNSQIIWGDNSRRDRAVNQDRNQDRNQGNRDYDRDRTNDRNRDRDRDYDRNRRDRDDNNTSYGRDSHGHLYDPSCVDNDRDGWCDYHRDIRSGVHVGSYPNGGNYPNGGTYPSGGNTGAIDRGQYPSQMPAMTSASLFKTGIRSGDVNSWLGRGALRAETSDSNGDGVPEQATWYDANGSVVQVWRDDNRDGRADTVDIYRNGQRVQVIR